MGKYKIVAGSRPDVNDKGHEILVPVYGTVYDGTKHHPCGAVIELSDSDAEALLAQGTVVVFDPDAEAKAARKAEAEAQAAAKAIADAHKQAGQR